MLFRMLHVNQACPWTGSAFLIPSVTNAFCLILFLQFALRTTKLKTLPRDYLKTVRYSEALRGETKQRNITQVRKSQVRTDTKNFADNVSGASTTD